MKLEKELTAASTVPLVLSILAEGESYGYAIIQRVHELSREEIKWTEGMLYPVLHWLENNRYIASRWQRAESGRKRKYYAITDAGRRCLKQQKEQWLVVHTTLKRTWRIAYA